MNAKGQVPEIRMYGPIHAHGEISSAKLDTLFQELINKGETHVKLRFNSPGGDVIDGMTMYNNIKASPLHVTGVVEGAAYSIAGLILQACDKRLVNKLSRVMIHDVQGGTMGTAAQLRNYAQMMEDWTVDLKATLKERTKKGDEVINEWLSKDSYFTPAKAIENGLADGYADEGVKNVSEPTNLDKTTAQAYYQSCQNELINYVQNLNSNMDGLKNFKTKLAAVLNLDSLSNDATDEAFVAAIQGKITSSETIANDLKNQMKLQKEAQITNLVNEAVKVGKIKETEKELFSKLLNSDFENGKKVLENMQPAVDVNSLLNKKGGKGGNGGDGKPEDGKDWNYYDKRGELVNLKKNDIDTFKALFKQEFGSEYKG